MASATSAVIVVTTFPADKDAAAFARQLVDERLAACVNVLPPMQSIYRWQGSIHEDAERQLLIKTTTDRVDALRARIKTLHPYDVPELLVLPVIDGSPEYLAWVGESVAEN